MNQKFKLISPYTPSGDQPEAINQLVQNINSGLSDMVLLGVTGSGKTYTIANVIERLQKPTLIISHNKTLAGQLYQEFREFFPKNAVEYFVSYYDYYQPESYIPSTDTYIEKEAQRNEDIERLRLSATTALSTRKDCIVIASVSCIYNLGSPVEYKQNILEIMSGVKIRKQDLLLKLINLQYERSDYDLRRATYRVSGDIVDIIPSYKLEIVRVEFLENKIEKISICDAVTGAALQEISQFVLFPAKHYITQEATREEGIKNIAKDMLIQIKFLESQNKI
ncbi:DEAD/DEAH box helicase family protein, partial [Patescibacteria group bacterium]|nr:DEAD/DEAH box helicase family protein [Patescibacteria group bacterium]